LFFKIHLFLCCSNQISDLVPGWSYNRDMVGCRTIVISCCSHLSTFLLSINLRIVDRSSIYSTFWMPNVNNNVILVIKFPRVLSIMHNDKLTKRKQMFSLQIKVLRASQKLIWFFSPVLTLGVAFRQSTT
jgi:hypothetical protein